MKMRIKIGSREIGDGCLPYIIAEVGSNFRNKQDCLTSITLAKKCGASAVKFQLYDHMGLYGVPGKLDSELDPTWLPDLKSKADACGIEFMCTAFSPEGVELVDKYVNVHKVASAECTHKRLLEAVRDTGKPVFLSTGAHGVKDIAEARMILGGGVSVVVMYCVAAYPAQEIELNNLVLMKKTFETLVGYSDHSTDVLNIPVTACHWGNAAVLEKHVNFVAAQGPDAPHSLNPEQFKRMVDRIHNRHETRIGPTPEEKPMVLRHNRRLIATRDVKRGDTFIEGANFGIYRSLKDDTHAFHPFAIDEVVGRLAKRDIAAGDGVGPGDV